MGVFTTQGSTLLKQEICSKFFIAVACDESADAKLFRESQFFESVDGFHFFGANTNLALYRSAAHTTGIATAITASRCSSSLHNKLHESLRILLNELVELWRLLLQLLHENWEEIRVCHKLLPNLLPLRLLHHRSKRIASMTAAHAACVLGSGLWDVSTHYKLERQVSISVGSVERLNAHITTSTGKSHQVCDFLLINRCCLLRRSRLHRCLNRRWLGNRLSGRGLLTARDGYSGGDHRLIFRLWLCGLRYWLRLLNHDDDEVVLLDIALCYGFFMIGQLLSFANQSLGVMSKTVLLFDLNFEVSDLHVFGSLHWQLLVLQSLDGKLHR